MTAGCDTNCPRRADPQAANLIRMTTRGNDERTCAPILAEQGNNKSRLTALTKSDDIPGVCTAVIEEGSGAIIRA